MSKVHDRIRELFGEDTLIAWDRDGMDLRDVSPHQWDDFRDMRKCQWREYKDSITL